MKSKRVTTMSSTELKTFPICPNHSSGSLRKPAGLRSASKRSGSLAELARRKASQSSSSVLPETSANVQIGSRKQLSFAPVPEIAVDIPKEFQEQNEEQPTTPYSPGSPVAKSEQQVITGDDDLLSTSSALPVKDPRCNFLKRLIAKIPLMGKAVVLVMIPILALLAYSVMDLQRSMDVSTEAEKVVAFAKLVAAIQGVEEAIVKCSFGALSAIRFPSNTSVVESFLSDVEEAHMAHENLTITAASLDLNEIFVQDAWRDAMVDLEKHDLIVRDVMKQSLTLKAAEKYYVHLLKSLKTSVAKGVSLTTDPKAHNAILALYYQAATFMYWGLEMALSVWAVEVGSFEDEDSYRMYLRVTAGNDKYSHLLHATEEYALIEACNEQEAVVQAMSQFREVREYMYQHELHPNISLHTLKEAMDHLIPAFSRELVILDHHMLDLSSSLSDSASQDIVTISISMVVLALVSYVLVALFVSSVHVVARLFQKEVDSRRKTEASVWRFFPQEFVSCLEAVDVFHLRAGNRTRLHMSVMFAQLRNFSEVSGKFTAEQTYDWLTDFVREIIPIVSEHGGFVDKTTGDGVMALFPTPEGAVSAAVDMQARMTGMNAVKLIQEEPPYDLRIGVHSGDVILGLIGTRKRLEGTIISDTVNTASRVQGMCKFYGSKIIVSEAIQKCVDLSSFGSRCLGSVRMKGKQQALTLYDIYIMDDPHVRLLKQRTIDEFNSARELYKEGRLEECVRTVDECIDRMPVVVEDGALKCRRKFARELQREKPVAWNGEDVFSAK